MLHCRTINATSVSIIVATLAERRALGQLHSNRSPQNCIRYREAATKTVTASLYSAPLSLIQLGFAKLLALY